VLWLIVGPDGTPRDIKVARALGMGLDQKAIEAVRNWKFEPALKDGKPVAVQINVEVIGGITQEGTRLDSLLGHYTNARGVTAEAQPGTGFDGQ
jgi:TonB family protein